MIESSGEDRETKVEGQGRRGKEGEEKAQEREAAPTDLEIVKCSGKCGIVTETEGGREQVKDDE